MKAETIHLTTAGGIADRLLPIARRQDTAALVERIRAWTPTFLTPAEQYGEGAGRHVQFDIDATVPLAALLTVLADAGLGVAYQRALVDAYSMARLALEKWRRSKGQLWLIMSQSPDRIEIAIQKKLALPDSNITHVIDLNRIWSAVSA
jgi:hypothetical protein